MTANIGQSLAEITTAVETNSSVSGIVLDQCGTSSTHHIVLFYCLAGESGGECIAKEELEDKVVVRDFNAKATK